MKNIMSITQARKDIFDIAEKVQKVGNHYMFTEGGKPKLVAMSADEYDNLMEDLALSADPRFRASIKQAEEDFRTGNYYTQEEIDEMLEKRQRREAGNLVFSVADKGKKKYSVKIRKNKK